MANRPRSLMYVALILTLAFLSLRQSAETVEQVRLLSQSDIIQPFRRYNLIPKGDSTKRYHHNMHPVPPGCPEAIVSARGLYREGSNRDEAFDDVVLLTAGNFGYKDFLQNWEYLASQLGLKWAVIAMDDNLYKTLGPERAVRSNVTAMTQDISSFRTPAFNQITCNKLRSVMDVMEQCNVDVVFSDADNVFFRDPFSHEFGKLIESRSFDYIYQPNDVDKSTTSQPRSFRTFRGEFPREANTGFYYLSRESEALKQVIKNALEECDKPDNTIDDQTLFWIALHAMRKANIPSKWKHCTAADVDAILASPRSVKESVSSRNEGSNKSTHICSLDPYYYPCGIEDVYPLINQGEIVTYHANHASSKEMKVMKLKQARNDSYVIGWDEARVKQWEFNLLTASRKVKLHETTT